MNMTRASQKRSMIYFQLTLLMSMVFWVAPLSATIVDILNTQGFESPTYLASPVGKPLNGQNDWLFTGGSSTAKVQNNDGTNPLQRGTQDVKVTRGANSDDRWAVPQSFIAPSAFLEITWEMKVAQRTGNGYGPFFGVEAYDANTSPFLLGSLGVDAKTGDVLYQAQDTGYLTESGKTVSFNTWNNFRVLLDYRSDIYSVYLNGSLLATTGFVDRSNHLDFFTDADISAIAAASDSVSQAATGTAYFDNFLVRKVSYVQDSVWNADINNGKWSVNSNWVSGTPSSDPNAVARFLTKITQPRTVLLDTDTTVGMVQFYNSNKYTLAGDKTLTLAGIHTIDVISGTHEIATTIAGSSGLIKTGPGTLILSGSLSYTGDTTVLAGTLEVGNLLRSGYNVSVLGTGSVLNASSIVANSLTISSISAAAVPEPSSIILLILGGLGITGYCWHRKQK
jgi:autotransporter-associated beta strand protein